MVVVADPGNPIVTVLPVTHSPPSNPALAVEIPPMTKRRLGLDDERSWVVLTEANRFTWPGPDLRMSNRDDPAGAVFGELPGRLLWQIRDKFIAAIKARNSALVHRTQ